MSAHLEFPHNLRSNYGSNRNGDVESKHISFLNYVPLDKELRIIETSAQAGGVSEIESKYSAMEREITEGFLKDENNQSINIIPKKPNVDLKRHLAKRLERLSKRTELAIYDLLRDKIKNIEVGGESSVEASREERPAAVDLSRSTAQPTKVPKLAEKQFTADGKDDYDEEGDEQAGQNLVEKMKLYENLAERQKKDLANDEEESD